MDPYLTATRVKDLTVEIDYKNSLEVFRWTHPGRDYNERTHQIEDFGDLAKREESLPYGKAASNS